MRDLSFPELHLPIAQIVAKEVLAERERCAKLAETMREDIGLGPVTDLGYKQARHEIAEAIRSGK